MKREINILFGILVAIFLAIWFVGSEYMPAFSKDSFVVLGSEKPFLDNKTGMINRTTKAAKNTEKAPNIPN